MPHDYDFLAPFWIVQAQNQGQASSPTNLITRIVFFPKNIPTLKYIPKPPIAPRHFQNQAPSLSICGGWAGPHWCSASACWGEGGVLATSLMSPAAALVQRAGKTLIAIALLWTTACLSLGCLQLQYHGKTVSLQKEKSIKNQFSKSFKPCFSSLLYLNFNTNSINVWVDWGKREEGESPALIEKWIVVLASGKKQVKQEIALCFLWEQSSSHVVLP